jgi:hypothetical protein
MTVTLGSVRAQPNRDEQTVLIATALGVFALVLTAEVATLWLLHVVFGVVFGVAPGIVLLGTIVVIVVAAVANLPRSEQR